MGFFSFIRKTAIKVSDIFAALVGKDNAQAFGIAAGAILKTALGSIVKTAVEAAQAQGLSGSQARATVFQAVSTRAQQAGIQTTNTLINLLIETAVAGVKGHFTI